MLTEQQQREHDADLEIVRRAVARLMENFETVQIFCTNTKQDGTRTISWGGGNWFARYGQVAYWLEDQRPCAEAEIQED